LRVTVCLTVQNRNAVISVIPSASSLVVQALKEPPRDRKKVKNSMIQFIHFIHFSFLPHRVLNIQNSQYTTYTQKKRIISFIYFLFTFFLVKHNGNIALEEIIKIARIMRPRSMAKEFSGTVKEILGTATSVGCTIEGQNPRDIIAQINDGTIEIPV